MSGRSAPDVEDRRSFDFAILGGGSAAFAAMIRARESGASVLLVNEGPIGGTCVNVGCVPSKTLLRAAENHHWHGLSRFRGIEPRGGTIDFDSLLREKDELVERLRTAKYEDVLAGLSGVRCVAGRGRLLGPTEIGVEGEGRFEAGKILIATGSRPRLPDVPGLAEAGVWDSTQALDAPFLPERLVVLGGSYVALELAQMFSRLGSRVTILQRSAQILSKEDPDVAESLAGFLRAEGIGVRTGRELHSVERRGERLFVRAAGDGGVEVHEADAVLAALGRRANVEGLGLEQAGVEVDAGGFVRVDDTLETTRPGIHAAGDVIGTPAFVYAAAYEGSLAASNALSGESVPRDYTAIPWVVFTDPQVAGVGLDERGAASAEIDVDVSVLSLEHVPRALAARDPRGFVKLLRERGKDRLVGARIVAPEGAEQIMEASLMIRFGLPVSQVAQHFHPYLTQGEAMKLAMLSFDRDVGSLSCCAS